MASCLTHVYTGLHGQLSNSKVPGCCCCNSNPDHHHLLALDLVGAVCVNKLCLVFIPHYGHKAPLWSHLFKIHCSRWLIGSFTCNFAKPLCCHMEKTRFSLFLILLWTFTFNINWDLKYSCWISQSMAWSDLGELSRTSTIFIFSTC